MTDFTETPASEHLRQLAELRGDAPQVDKGRLLFGVGIAMVLAFHLDAAYPAGPLADADDTTFLFYGNGHRVAVFDTGRIFIEHADGAVYLIDPLGSDSEDWEQCVATAFANPQVPAVEVSEEVIEEVLASDAEVR